MRRDPDREAGDFHANGYDSRTRYILYPGL